MKLEAIIEELDYLRSYFTVRFLYVRSSYRFLKLYGMVFLSSIFFIIERARLFCILCASLISV